VDSRITSLPGPKYFAVDEAFDRWFLDLLGQGSSEHVLREVTIERMVAGGVEYIAELFDLAAHQRLQRPGDAADGAHRVGNIAEYELSRIVACIHVAVQLLGVAGTGKQRASLRARDTGPDKQKLRIAGETA